MGMAVVGTLCSLQWRYSGQDSRRHARGVGLNFPTGGSCPRRYDPYRGDQFNPGRITKTRECFSQFGLDCRLDRGGLASDFAKRADAQQHSRHRINVTARNRFVVRRDDDVFEPGGRKNSADVFGV